MMTVALDIGRWGTGETEDQAIGNLLNVLMNGITHGTDQNAEAAYKMYRNALIEHPEFQDVIPAAFRRFTTLNPFVSDLLSDRKPRKQAISELSKLMTPLVERAASLVESNNKPQQSLETQEFREPLDSAAWTGGTTPYVKLSELKKLLPATIAFVDSQIKSIESAGHNGGPDLNTPPISDLEPLRQLHTLLGELLAMAESSHWNETKFEGLASNIVSLCQRIAGEFGNDRPYATGLIMVSAAVGMFFPSEGASLLAGSLLGAGKKR